VLVCDFDVDVDDDEDVDEGVLVVGVLVLVLAADPLLDKGADGVVVVAAGVLVIVSRCL
jgi:hypothetical protein